MTYTLEIFKANEEKTDTVLKFEHQHEASNALRWIRDASNLDEYRIQCGAIDAGLYYYLTGDEIASLDSDAVYRKIYIWLMEVDRSELGDPMEAYATLLRAHFPSADDETIETYLYGPDNPSDYFSKIESTDELYDDFQSFLDNA